VPSSNYYGEQAKLLLRWAFATRDPERSKELLARARDLEGLAARAADTKVDLNLLLEDFNDNQMRKRDSS